MHARMLAAGGSANGSNRSAGQACSRARVHDPAHLRAAPGRMVCPCARRPQMARLAAAEGGPATGGPDAAASTAAGALRQAAGAEERAAKLATRLGGVQHALQDAQRLLAATQCAAPARVYACAALREGSQPAGRYGPAGLAAL